MIRFEDFEKEAERKRQSLLQQEMEAKRQREIREMEAKRIEEEKRRLLSGDQVLNLSGGALLN